MVLGGQDIAVGSARPSVLPLNLPLVRHLALEADDIRKLEVSLDVKRAPAGMEILSEGKVEQIDIDLAADGGLQDIELEAGEALVIGGWKASWHYHGYVELENLEIAGTTKGGESFDISLPDTWSDPKISIEAGELQAIGLSQRDKFPEISKVATTTASEKAGEFTLPDTKGFKITAEGKRVRMHSQGRASFKDASADWAPALQFIPKKSCTISLRGKLQVRSGKEGQEMSYFIARLLPKGASLAGASLAFRNGSTGPVMATHTFPDSPKDKETVTLDLTDLARKEMSSTAKGAHLEAIITHPDAQPRRAIIAKNGSGQLTLTSHPKHVLFENSIKPRDGVFATHEKGTLVYGGKPLRLWSTVKDGSGERFRALGFNAVRVWFQSDFYTAESAKNGVTAPAVKGDGSKLDRYDQFMADLRKNDLFVMFGSCIGRGMPTKSLLADDSWIAGGADWKEWKAAVEKDDNESFDYIDERLWKVRLRHASNVLDHRNLYTGKRYAEEESIALIEINNERGIIVKWLDSGFEKWPEYFRNKLQRKWNEWLLKRYSDDAGLRAAWGELKSGESVGKNSLKLAPAHAERKNYPDARGHDFVLFLTELVDERNREFVAHCRALAPEGTGAAVVPFSYDSQYKPSLPWLFSNSLGDTSTISMYFWHNGSSLTKSPKLYLLDTHSAADKLTVVYETGRSRPSPYRSEHPYMLAVLSAWQGFDIVSWHGNWMGESSPEELLAGTAPPPTNHFWTGVHLEHDPTMSSSVALAGRIFLDQAVEESPDPAVFTMGRESAAGYRNWNGLTNDQMSALTFSRGTRIAFDPEKAGGFLNPEGDFREQVQDSTEAVNTGKSVVWDWPNGRLIIDSPTAKVYVGPSVSSYRFRDGITLSGLHTEWISFSMVSMDGKPLTGEGATDRALVSAVYSSVNTGFEYDWEVSGSPTEMAKAVKSQGHAPVLMDEVPFTLSFPHEFSGTWRTYDFAMRQTSETKVEKKNTIRQRGETPWMSELVFTSHGGQKIPEIDPGVDFIERSVTEKLAEATDESLAELPMPISGLSWGDNRVKILNSLRADGLKNFTTPTPNRIEVASVKDVFAEAVDAELSFRDETLREILFTFTESADLDGAIGHVSKLHGKPNSVNIVEDAFKESTATWKLPSLEIIASRVQGVVRVRYRR